MAFEAGRKRGRTWEDSLRIHETISRFPFHTTGSNENAFERGLATTLMVARDDYHLDVITQIDRERTVQSIYCFGKNHRPDMTLGENGIAIEIKYITYSGIKNAVGQGYVYRLRYKFVFLVLIVSEESKDTYADIENGQEKPLEDLLAYLAEEMNIFSYIVPAFKVKSPGMRKIIPFFAE